MSTVDRRALFTSGAAAALLAATGVSAAGTGPQPGGRLRAALSGASRGDMWGEPNPGLFMRAAAQGAVFDTLTEIAAKGTLRGELATRWTGSADAREWIFDLREDAVFHNGIPFGAVDVVASVQRHRRNGLLQDVTEIQVAGPACVRIVLARSNADFPFLLSDPSLVIYPAHETEAAVKAGVGTGLYRVKKFLPGRQFLGVRVEEHYKDGKSGWFETVEFTSVPDARVRAQALEGGYVDVADQIDPSGLTGTGDAVKIVHQFAVRVEASLAMSDASGTRWPLDNYRMAERWWLT
ncbi:HTH-type transcriptional regulator SgrR (plasmid) [Pseudoseohaeicola sp. NH-UV-7]|uniref:ABC transporter substrate-binding protein n=1 Tax=unclassified Sulfitobacter TaxID=196795 RepID=UPI000E0C4BF4|nr:ABC transporter substrate-binding protein [Sulfitobacter sp. JL08]AXI56561.1 peptide ABC transporter substrate-binding protein [Sulfitobacter sp. JL08]